MVVALSSETLIHLLHNTATYPRRQFSSKEGTLWVSAASEATTDCGRGASPEQLHTEILHEPKNNFHYVKVLPHPNQSHLVKRAKMGYINSAQPAL
jgi:hypothetical protein